MLIFEQYQRRIVCFAALGCLSLVLGAQSAAEPAQLDADREAFLKTAKVLSVQETIRGVTRPLRATLSDGKRTHDALIQRVNKNLPPLFAPDDRPVAWRDCYLYNYAAYALDRLLGLHISPPTVLRDYEGQPAAFTWWLDDVMMDEQKRLVDKIEPPNPEKWNEQLAIADVFDQLIFNTDRNLGNVLITKDWRLILIDHTRSFPAKGVIREPDKLRSITPEFLQALERVSRPDVVDAMNDALTAAEIDALLARRDRIVEKFRN